MPIRGGRSTLGNVQRIPAPPARQFDRGYLRTGTPVILTGAFEGIPEPHARKQLADMPLLVTPNTWGEYLQGVDRPERAGARHIGFGAFLDELAARPGTDAHCVEYSTPPELCALLPRLPYQDIGDRADGWESYVFLAGRGNTTHLHYDFDLRHVLMYQVFGRKRYVVIDPAESRKLGPGSRAQVRRTSALFLEHMSDDDLLGFLRYTNAWDCILEPGEILLIPAGCWHYVEYVDTALSVNLCLARNRWLRGLADILPESSVEMIALASRFRDGDRVGRDEAAAFKALRDADARHYPDEAARVAALDALCVALCAHLGLPVAGAQYHLADVERRARITGRTTRRRALGVAAAHR